MEVYKASDYEDGEAPLTTLTTKTLSSPLAKGDSDSISFTWAVKNGDFIFVAILDPDDTIKEVDETNNSCLLYTSPSPRDRTRSRMPSSA